MNVLLSYGHNSTTSMTAWYHLFLSSQDRKLPSILVICQEGNRHTHINPLDNDYVVFTVSPTVVLSHISSGVFLLKCHCFTVGVSGIDHYRTELLTGISVTFCFLGQWLEGPKEEGSDQTKKDKRKGDSQQVKQSLSC